MTGAGKNRIMGPQATVPACVLKFRTGTGCVLEFLRCAV